MGRTGTLYAETLVVNISELAENFAMHRPTLFEQMNREERTLMEERFRAAYDLLKEIREKRELGLWEIARAYIERLRTIWQPAT